MFPILSPHCGRVLLIQLQEVDRASHGAEGAEGAEEEEDLHEVGDLLKMLVLAPAVQLCLRAPGFMRRIPCRRLRI
jgi:hypothetical protein